MLNSILKTFLEIMKKLTDKEYKFIFSRVPRLCVDLIIKTEKGILLTRRAIEPHKGKWHFPGGGVKIRESIQEAAERIAQSELGLKLNRIKLLGFMEFIHDGDYIHSVSLVFLAKLRFTELKLDSQSTKAKIFSSLPAKRDTHQTHYNYLLKNQKKIFQ